MLSNPFILFPLLTVLTGLAYATWRQWHIRYVIRREMRKFDHIKLHGEDTMTVFKPEWRQ